MGKHKKKRIQSPKKGKVIRVSAHLADYIHSQRQVGESWDTALRRILGADYEADSPIQRKFMWTLPSRLMATKGEATGIAIFEAAKDGRPLTEKESPIKVYEA